LGRLSLLWKSPFWFGLALSIILGLESAIYSYGPATDASNLGFIILPWLGVALANDVIEGRLLLSPRDGRWCNLQPNILERRSAGKCHRL